MTRELKSKRYRFRAEIFSDVKLCHAALQGWVSVWIEESCYLEDKDGSVRRIPDMEVEFEIRDVDFNDHFPEITIQDIWWMFAQFSDLHVAAETLSLKEMYTGDRTHYIILENAMRNYEPSPEVQHRFRLNLIDAIDVSAGIVSRILHPKFF